MVSAAWALDGRRAALHLGQWRGEFDLDKLSEGIRDLRHGPTGLPITSLFALATHEAERAPRASDSYVRGNDLFAKYEGINCLELHWRATAPGGLGCLILDLQLSANTARLNTIPRLEVLTRIRGESRPISGGILAELAGIPWKLLIMAHPTDFCGATIAQFGDARHLSLRILDEHLEKGVIRRARLRAIIIERKVDEQRLIAFQHAFQNEEPDLSA